MSLPMRRREFPERGGSVDDALIAFLGFIQTTAVNKVADLNEEQARSTPLSASPAMSLLGVVKHMTAVLRQHVQIHIGGADLLPMWRADDPDYEFRLDCEDTIDDVVARFDAEWERSVVTLARVSFNDEVETYGRPNTVGRVLVDVTQELARHLGHMDILRELVDGARGE